VSNLGWVCPKCGGCFAPTVTRCENHPGVVEITAEEPRKERKARPRTYEGEFGMSPLQQAVVDALENPPEPDLSSFRGSAETSSG
jgi:hypothetical protein